MFGWHSFARQQKAMRQHLRQAVKHYDGRKLQGQVLLHWKRWCNLEGRTNVRPGFGFMLWLCAQHMHSQLYQSSCIANRLTQHYLAVLSCHTLHVPGSTGLIQCCKVLTVFEDLACFLWN